MESYFRQRCDVILFLGKQNLSFRGHREAFESNNQGNFLDSVKLLENIVPYSANTFLVFIFLRT